LKIFARKKQAGTVKSLYLRHNLFFWLPSRQFDLNRKKPVFKGVFADIKLFYMNPFCVDNK